MFTFAVFCSIIVFTYCEYNVVQRFNKLCNVLNLVLEKVCKIETDNKDKDNKNVNEFKEIIINVNELKQEIKLLTHTLQTLVYNIQLEDHEEHEEEEEEHEDHEEEEEEENEDHYEHHYEEKHDDYDSDYYLQ